jgi:hypothetical protein
MALLVAITNDKGVTANYHRILSVTEVYETDNEGVHINLAGYVNKGYRDKEKMSKEGESKPNTIVSNTPVFLPFVAGENFNLKSLYARLKVEILELKASTDI